MKDALARVIAAVKGWRTFIIFSPIALLAFLQAISAIDLTPLWVALDLPEPTRAAITTFLAVLAIGLRIYTTTPPMQAAPPAVPAVPPIEEPR